MLGVSIASTHSAFTMEQLAAGVNLAAEFQTNPFSESYAKLWKAVADKHARGRMVSLLEGGYELHALGRSVATHLKVLAGL